MYTGMCIVLFMLFVIVREQLQSCEASNIKVADESLKEKISCRDELLNDIIFKMIEWKQKCEEKLAIIEGDIREIQFNLKANTESERKLKIESMRLHKQELENSNFNRIMIYDLFCLMGK